MAPKKEQEPEVVQKPLLFGRFPYPRFLFTFAITCTAVVCLAYAFIIAYMVRMYSVKRYGYLIHEFDPWFNFRATKYLSENGWHAFFHWFDRMSWYPIGRPVGTTIYPGLQITAVAIHRALGALGYPMTLTQVCVTLPAWFGTVATVFAALLSYELNFSLLSAGITAVTFCISPSHTMRSMAGEFDNECIAVAAMICTFYFWVRSLRTPSSWPIGVVTGLAYGYMVASWGGYIFVLNMVALHAGVTALVDWMHNRYNASLVKAYGLFFIIGTAIAVRVPPVGLTPFKSLEQLSAVVVFAFLVALHLSEAQRVKAGVEVRSRACLRMRLRVLSMMAVGFCAIAIMLVPTGYFGPLSSRVRALFVKHTRTGNPLVDSVAEHQPTSDGAYAHFLGWCALAWFAGAFYLAIESVFFPVPSRIFIVLYSVASFYFSRRMSRLILLTGPAATCVSGFLLASMIHNAIDALYWMGRNKSFKEDKKKKHKSVDEEPFFKNPVSSFRKKSPWIYLLMNIVCFMLSLYLLLGTGYLSSNRVLANSLARPHIVFEARIPDPKTGTKDILVKDYLDAYQWLKMKTPEDARILAWWDYGYQITGIGERTSLADGNTWNHEHIATLGKMLTSPIEEAHSLVRHMADYVLIWSGQTGDDLRKSPHMARIGNSVYRDICPKDPLCAHFGFFDHGFKRPTPMMRKSLLYHLHSAGLVEDVHVPPHLFQEVYRSRYSLVRIYKVMNVSEESKAWIADPANHVCSEKEPWICPGQYPPAKEIQDMLAKRVDFSQLEDFNRGKKDDEYYKAYMDRIKEGL